MKRWLIKWLLCTSVLLAPLASARAQGSSLVRLVESASAMEGAKKIEAVLKLGRGTQSGAVRTLLQTPEGRKLLTDSDVLAFTKELEGSATAELLAKNPEASELLTVIRQSNQIARSGVETACSTGNCQLKRLGTVMDDIEATAMRAAQGGSAAAEDATKGLRIGSLAGNSVPLGEDVKLVVEGAKLSDETSQMVKAVSDARSQIKNTVENISKTCGKDSKCVEEAVDAVSKEPWFKRLFRNSCLGRHPAAVRAMLYSYTVAYSSLGIAYAVTDNPEFPFDMAAYTLVAGAMYSELGCRNTYERGKVDGEDTPYYTWRNIRANFIAYAKLEPINIAVFMGFSMGEDAARGRDITDPEYLMKYAKEGAYLLLFDIGVLNMRAVLLTDPLYLRGMPRVSGRLTELWSNGVLGRVVSENGRKGVLWAVAAGTPAAILETGTRVGQGSAERALFLHFREVYAPAVPEGGPQGEPQPE